jgi:hypothetical protein
MLNLLVETKNEYTIHLINILTPLIYEGFISIYKKAQNISKNNDILKIFQDFLRQIPDWSKFTIDNESIRIINSSHSNEWLSNLIKATIKANIIVLMYNPCLKIQQKINPVFYQKIQIPHFIHRVYIECARELWTNPYLLFHEYPPIEIKRNQRDCMNIIKECIKEALRKLLPVKHILEVYLGEELENDETDDFNKPISEVEKRNITKLINKDLEGVSLPQDKLLHPILEYNNEIDENNESSLDKTIGSKILDIINNKNNDIDSNDDNNIDKLNKSIEKISPNILKIKSKEFKNNIVNTKDFSENLEKISKSIESEFNTNTNTKKNKDKKNNDNIDVRIKKILAVDLDSNSDFDTSINNEPPIEFFSNSVLSSSKKVFNNYMLM